jgi:hypothetical protein
MVTWTFDLMALCVGFFVGMLVGGILSVIIETRDGGAWAKGFFEGCDKKFLINYLENEKERMRGFKKSTKEDGNDSGR